MGWFAPFTGLVNRFPRVATAAFMLVGISVVGTAVDMSNTVVAKAELQEALDVAALSVVRDIETKTDDEVRRSVQKMIEERLVTEQDLQSLTVAVDRKSKRLRCKATVRVDTTLASLLGVGHFDVVASTDAGAEVPRPRD